MDAYTDSEFPLCFTLASSTNTKRNSHVNRVSEMNDRDLTKTDTARRAFEEGSAPLIMAGKCQVLGVYAFKSLTPNP